MLQATLVLARLRSHLGRSLVLVVVVAVASGIALSALAVLRVADDPWAPLVAATNGADVEIDEAPARPDPRALTARSEVETVGVLIESGDAALQVHGAALLVSLMRLPEREAMVVDRPLLMAGRWFAADDEVVFEVTLADTLGIRVGDTVTLNGEHGRSVRVVGTAAATTMLPNYPERVPGGVFAGAALFDAIDPVGAPRWSIGLRLRDPSRADEVVARLNATGPVPSGSCTAAGWCARTSADIRDNAFPTRVDGFAQIMLFFATLILIAAVLLIVTLLGSRLVSEARELTLLQVAGATPARLALLIAAEHALLAAAGTAAGILVARAVAPRIAEAAATVFGSVSPRLSLGDVMAVGAAAVAVSVLVSAIGGLRAGRRSLAVVARGGSGRVRRSRAATLAMRSFSSSTLVLGLKDVATRRGRAIVTVLSVTLAVTITVAIVGLGTSELDPAIAPTRPPASPPTRPTSPACPCSPRPSASRPSAGS
jgi:putative ABC transport system permease protein